MTATDALRVATRPLRRVARLFATSDPDRARLRLATSTILILVVVAIVLFVGATLAGQVVTAVIPGIILAMISSMAVRDPAPGPRAVTILLLVPTALAAIALASVLSGTPLLADAVFVAVAVVAVYLRALGPRGMVLGMLAFMSYFLAVFIRLTPAQLPVVAAALLVSAGVVIGLRMLLAPRHPDRDLRRMIAALGYRAARVTAALREGVEEGRFDERLRRTVLSRLAASASVASSVEQVLDGAQEPVVAGIGNDELGVRVFDFQLTLEHLTETVRRFVDAVHEPVHGDRALVRDGRADLAAGLARFERVVGGSVRLGRQERPRPGDTAAPETWVGIGDGPVNGPGTSSTPVHDSAAGAGERLAQLDRILRFGADAWASVASRGPDALGGDDRADADRESARTDADDDGADHEATGDDGPGYDLGALTRQAVQVAVAAALAIAAGTALSSTRWFWAVIAAFVVYVGTSSRGEILTKGWLRVVGTLAGVVVGVLVAALVGGNTLVAVVLIAACLFLGVYLMSISSAFMIFFITTMLALLYGLLGQFSIGLLLTRLAETAAGAAIGVLVAYVVFPTSTRDVARDRTRDFLADLGDAVGSSAARLAQEVRSDVAAAPASPAPDDARTLRQDFDAIRTAAKPITEGLAGVADRSGSRRTMLILGACEHHGRSLLRLADGAPGIADTPALREHLGSAAAAVRANIDAFASGLGGRIGTVGVAPAGPLLDALEAHPDAAASRHRAELVAAARNLRAIDQALCGRAEELGAEVSTSAEPAPARASR